jgi:hypothetical protein
MEQKLSAFPTLILVCSSIFLSTIAHAIDAKIGIDCSTGLFDCTGFAEAQKLAKKEESFERCFARKSKQKRPDPAGACKYSVNLYSNDVCTGAGVSWVRLERLDYWEEVQELLRNRAESGLIAGPDKRWPTVVVELLRKTKGSQDQYLGICEISHIDQAYGPLKSCRQIAVIRDNIFFIKATLKGDLYCSASTTIRVGGGTINVDFEVKTKIPLVQFVESINLMLKEELGFSTEVIGPNGTDVPLWSSGRMPVNFDEPRIIRSTAALRESRILEPTWREAIDLDIVVSKPVDSVVRISGSMFPLVFRQASANRIDYHPPSDAQKGIYASAIDGRIAAAIKRICGRVSQIDSKNIICE